MFENAIQACVDLAKHVASEDFGYHGDGSKEAVAVLADNGVLEADTAATLTDAVGFRNVLAHEYGDVRPELVYDYLQEELTLYESFGQQVARWYEEAT